VVPNLLHPIDGIRRGSVICLDIKGEHFAITSGYRSKFLGQRVFRFDAPAEHGRTHGFNVLDYVRDGDLRVTDVQTIAAILVPNEAHDPYWDNVARDLMVGLILLVLEAGPAKGWPISIGQVHRLLRSEEESGEYLEALLKELAGQGVALSSLCRRYILSFCHEPEKPRGSINSALATKLTLWANPLIDRATSRTDFDLRRLRKEPMSLYIAIAPDDLQRLGPLVRLLIEFFLAANTKAGETPADDPDLNVPALLLLLDEFLSLGRMEKLVHALSYVRGWGIRIATVIQSEAQLHAVYGGELAEAFIDNHRARVYYRPPVHRRDLAEGISKIVGQKTVKQTSFSYADNKRSRQVSKTGQAILDAD
jgi:type IV secretion system protein VirD4